VALCLQKDPTKRPTAKLLVKHKFIKLGKKTGMLTDLIERKSLYVSDKVSFNQRVFCVFFLFF
jgi:serine/threonine-protein kinase 24/25/MST4